MTPASDPLFPPTTAADRPAGGGVDIVSQSEIEQLLAQVESSNPSLTAALPAGTAIGTVRENSKRHTFPKLSLFSPAELRPLRMRHEDFITALAARISIHLGLEVALQMSKLEVMPFQTFVESLSNPTYLSLVKLPPLEGICLLDMTPKLALAIVDRELGGPGRAPDEVTQIGKMEARLLTPFVGIIANEWCATWKDLLEVRPQIVGSEGNSRYVNTSTPQTSMLVVGIQATFGETIDQMQIAFPHPMLEPLTTKLTAGANTPDKAAAKPSPAKWGPLLDSVSIELKAQLPGIELSAGQVAELKVGDVITFPPDFINSVEVLLAGYPGFIGTLGVSNQRRAVRIEKRLTV